MKGLLRILIIISQKYLLVKFFLGRVLKNHRDHRDCKKRRGVAKRLFQRSLWRDYKVRNSRGRRKINGSFRGFCKKQWALFSKE